MPAESPASEASVSALYSTLQDLGCEVTNIRLRIEQDIFSLQDQNSALQLSVDQLQHTLSESLERLDRRVNSLAGQIDQVKAVQERLSDRIGTLEEKVRIAKAYSEHQTIVATRLSRRLQEVEGRLQ